MSIDSSKGGGNINRHFVWKKTKHKNKNECFVVSNPLIARFKEIQQFQQHIPNNQSHGIVNTNPPLQKFINSVSKQQQQQQQNSNGPTNRAVGIPAALQAKLGIARVQSVTSNNISQNNENINNNSNNNNNNLQQQHQQQQQHPQSQTTFHKTNQYYVKNQPATTIRSPPLTNPMRQYKEKNLNIDARKVAFWTVSDVIQWLLTFHVGKLYIATFAQESVTGYKLINLTLENLKQMGIQLEQHRHRIMYEINELKSFSTVECFIFFFFFNLKNSKKSYFFLFFF